MFSRTSSYFLDAISTLLQVDEIPAGEHLYKSGSVCRSLLIIASGTVETVILDPSSQQWVVSRLLFFSYHTSRALFSLPS